eukprot:m.242286 g.242286  ORF g.242286 m.242286 type:complete len:560 (+) comp14003_c0_seq1:169-1848(+)
MMLSLLQPLLVLALCGTAIAANSFNPFPQELACENIVERNQAWRQEIIYIGDKSKPPSRDRFVASKGSGKTCMRYSLLAHHGFNTTEGPAALRDTGVRTNALGTCASFRAASTRRQCALITVAQHEIETALSNTLTRFEPGKWEFTPSDIADMFAWKTVNTLPDLFSRAGLACSGSADCVELNLFALVYLDDAEVIRQLPVLNMPNPTPWMNRAITILRDLLWIALVFAVGFLLITGAFYIAAPFFSADKRDALRYLHVVTVVAFIAFLLYTPKVPPSPVSVWKTVCSSKHFNLRFAPLCRPHQNALQAKFDQFVWANFPNVRGPGYPDVVNFIGNDAQVVDDLKLLRGEGLSRMNRLLVLLAGTPIGKGLSRLIFFFDEVDQVSMPNFTDYDQKQLAAQILPIKLVDLDQSKSPTFEIYVHLFSPYPMEGNEFYELPRDKAIIRADKAELNDLKWDNDHIWELLESIWSSARASSSQFADYKFKEQFRSYFTVDAQIELKSILGTKGMIPRAAVCAARLIYDKSFRGSSDPATIDVNALQAALLIPGAMNCFSNIPNA